MSATQHASTLPVTEGMRVHRATYTRFPGLDALRAIAVLLTFAMHFAWLYAATYMQVDLEHARLNSRYGAEWAWTSVQYYSLYGVYVFFMISGLLIAIKLVGSPRPPSFLLYLRERGMRIFPAYWVALVAALLLSFASKEPLPYALQDALANATLLAWFDPHAFRPWLIVSWSLHIEWIFYLTMPIICAAIRWMSVTYRAFALIMTTLAVMVGLKALGGRDFAYPAYFAIGIGCALWPDKANGLARRLRLLPAIVLLAALHLGYALVEPIGADKPAWHVGAFDVFAVAFALIGGAMFIRITFYPPQALLHPFVLALGRTSYSFYLWHLTVLTVLFALADHTGLSAALMAWPWPFRWTLLATSGVAGTVLIARLSFVALEAPYFRRKQRAGQR